VIREVLEVETRGFIFKSDAARDLVAAVEAPQGHTTFFTSDVATIVLGGYLTRSMHPEKPAKNRITARERKVVKLLAEGKSSKEVAVALNLSVKTAETHRTDVMRKLDLHSVATLSAMQCAMRLCTLPEPVQFFSSFPNQAPRSSQESSRKVDVCGPAGHSRPHGGW